MNRHVERDERALEERRTATPFWPRVLIGCMDGGLPGCRDSGMACGLSLSSQRTQRVNVRGSVRRNEAGDYGHKCHAAYGQ